MYEWNLNKSERYLEHTKGSEQYLKYPNEG
jgi:hypothetical protein